MKQYKSIRHLQKRIEKLSEACRKADDSAREARIELWSLYAQETLLKAALVDEQVERAKRPPSTPA